jgi:hypothetical protein
MSKNPFADFDYRISCDDFLLYELGRLIEEDRASFEDEEFRSVIGSGIHEHIERRLEIRAELALRLRESSNPPARTILMVEDIESPLGEIPQIIQSYTAYLFQRLEECSATPPDERITTAADLLLESADDSDAAETAIDVLGSVRSAVSARVLAYAISEPMLKEDLELKAYKYVRDMWPLPRHFILHSLKPHTHEDIPFRWYQLLIDCDEPSVVDRILEEVLVHADDTDYREDLLALVQLLDSSRDPETEDKILQVLNSQDSPRASVELLKNFLKTAKTQKHRDVKPDSPWASLNRIYSANGRYLEVARLFDAGKRSEAARELDELLKDEPQYPLALMLKRLL